MHPLILSGYSLGMEDEVGDEVGTRCRGPWEISCAIVWRLDLLHTF